MVAARKVPIAPSRTNSTQNSASTKKSLPKTIPRESTPPSLPVNTESKDNSNVKVKVKPRSRVSNHLFTLLLTFFAIYSATTCRSSTAFSSPICVALDSYRTHFLEPYIVTPIQSTLHHPSLQPLHPYAHAASDAIRPRVSAATHAVKARYNAQVAPAASEFWAHNVLPVYQTHLQPHAQPYIIIYQSRVLPTYHTATERAGVYIEQAKPHVHATYVAIQKYSIAAYEAARPRVLAAYAWLKPHVIILYNKSKVYGVIFLAKAVDARREFVDPHIRRIWDKVGEAKATAAITASSTPTVVPSEPTPVKEEPLSASSVIQASVHAESGAAADLASSAAEAASSSSAAAASASLEAASSSAAALSSSAAAAASSSAAAASASLQAASSSAAAAASSSLAAASSSAAAASSSAAEAAASSSASEAAASPAPPKETPAPEATPSPSSTETEPEETQTKTAASAASIIAASLHVPVANAQAQAPLSSSSSEPDVEILSDETADIDDFLRDIGLDETLVSSPDTPPSSESHPTDPSVQPEQTESERLAATAAQRASIVSRHVTWQAQLDALIAERTLGFGEILNGFRGGAVRELAGLFAKEGGVVEGVEAEAGKLFKGLEGYLGKMRGRVEGMNAGEREEEKVKWGKVIEKVEEKFAEKVRSVQGEVHEWYLGVREGEGREVRRVAAEIKSFAEKAQADIGLDYAWLDDVTYQDWQKYHDLMRASERFAQTLESIQNGTHTGPGAAPRDVLVKALDALEAEMQDVIQGFLIRVQSVGNEAGSIFNTPVKPPADETKPESESESTESQKTQEPKETPSTETKEEGEPQVSILPIDPEPQPREGVKPAEGAEHLFVGKDAEQVRKVLEGVQVEPEFRSGREEL